MALKPKITVVIPVYNVEAYLSQCLDSVTGQTMADIEIIVVNDCSQDNSADIARSYAERDPRIRIIVHEFNRGLSVARNTGMNSASAPLVMFVDSDDWVEPDYCRKMYDALTPEVDAAVCGIRIVYETDRHLVRKDERWTVVPPRRPKFCNTTAWNKIYRLGIIRDHDIQFPPGLKNEDEYFWNAYQPWCRAMAFVPEKLYNYRRRADGIMNRILAKKDAVRADLLHIAAELGDYYDRHGLMQNEEGAKHYWQMFDILTRHAQAQRPERFRRKKLRNIFKLKKTR